MSVDDSCWLGDPSIRYSRIRYAIHQQMAENLKFHFKNFTDITQYSMFAK